MLATKKLEALKRQAEAAKALRDKGALGNVSYVMADPTDILALIEAAEGLGLARQWFDHVCDTNPEYLTHADYELGVRLYQACGMRVPNKLRDVLRQYESQ